MRSEITREEDRRQVLGWGDIHTESDITSNNLTKI